MAPKRAHASTNVGKPAQRFSQEVFDLNKRIRLSYFSTHASHPQSLNPKSLILGPNCPASDIDLLTQYYPLRQDGEVMHQLSHLYWTNWELPKLTTCFRSWPSQKLMWLEWVRRMSTYLVDIWGRLGIEHMICLSTADIPQDPTLIAAAAGFWSPSCNALLLNCGFLSPTILDVLHLTGFHSSGIEVHPFMSRPIGDETFSLNFSSSTGYQAFLSQFAKLGSDAEPSKTETVAFYLYWLCSFVFCVPGVKPAKEYITLALHLFHQEKLALAPALLGSLYRGINLFVSKRISNSTQGPMWLFQAWLKAYFPFSLGKYSTLFDSEPSSYAEFFLGHYPSQNIRAYFQSFYKIDRNGAAVDFNPFKDKNFNSSNLEVLLPPFSSPLAFPLAIFWSHLLVPRFLPSGTSSKTILEPYTPSQMARQFGLSQGVPMPFLHPTYREMSGEKYSLGPSQKDVLNRLSKEFDTACQTFSLPPFDTSFGYDTLFGDWWDLVVPILFPSNMEDCCTRFLTKSTDEPVPIQNHLDINGNYVEVPATSVSSLKPILLVPSPSKGKRKLTTEELLEEEKTLKQRKTETPLKVGDKLLAQSIRASTAIAEIPNTRKLRSQKEKSPSRPIIVQTPSNSEDESDEIPLIRKKKLPSTSQVLQVTGIEIVSPPSPRPLPLASQIIDPETNSFPSSKPLPLVDAVPLSQISFEQEQNAFEDYSDPPSLEKDSTEPIEPSVHGPVFEPVNEIQKKESTSKLHEGCTYVVDAYRQYVVNRGMVIFLLVESIDVYLLGTVMLVFGMGLYELFISNLDIPRLQLKENVKYRSNLFGLFTLKERPKWLEIKSVNELKTKLGHVIVMLLLIGLVEKSKKAAILTAFDLLCFSASVLLSSVSLYLLSKLNGSDN